MRTIGVTRIASSKVGGYMVGAVGGRLVEWDLVVTRIAASDKW